MAHHSDYYLRFQIEHDNELVLVNEARWKTYSLDVYKYNITKNEVYMRGNVQFTNLGGWLVNYPGEIVKTYYYGDKVTIKTYPFEKIKNRIPGLEYGGFEQSWTIVKNKILTCHSEMKYLIKKIDFENVYFNVWKLLELMLAWKEHPLEVEILAAQGFYNIATNRNLYRLSKAKQKEIIAALKNFKDDPKLIDVQNFIKSGLQFEEWYGWRCWNHWQRSGIGVDSIEVYRYCKRKNIDKWRYHDMVTMAAHQGHDITNDYWRFPNDPEAMHQKLLEAKMELERIEREKELEKEKVFWNQLAVISKKNKLINPVDLGNGYMLFMPTTYEEYNQAATILHQCILASKYYQKVAEGRSLLLMIWKDGKPSSTCEIDFNKKILQFYGNELDRQNCKPSEYEQDAMNNFLIGFKPKKVTMEAANA